MEFIFVLTSYNDVLFKPQVSKALEKRTELNSRKKYLKMWKYIDKVDSKKKVSEEILKKRRSRYKIYGIILLFLGFFLLIPSLMEPKEMLIPLIVSVFTIFIGLLYFTYVKRLKKVKLTSFDKAAIKLFGVYEKMSGLKIEVTFTNDKIQLIEKDTIGYGEIEKIFITQDFFILIWNEKITVLQKKDLSSFNVEEFINFIIYKSQNLFEVENIV